jgi:hypothetical protein
MIEQLKISIPTPTGHQGHADNCMKASVSEPEFAPVYDPEVPWFHPALTDLSPIEAPVCTCDNDGHAVNPFGCGLEGCRRFLEAETNGCCGD